MCFGPPLITGFPRQAGRIARRPSYNRTSWTAPARQNMSSIISLKLSDYSFFSFHVISSERMEKKIEIQTNFVTWHREPISILYRFGQNKPGIHNWQFRCPLYHDGENSVQVLVRNASTVKQASYFTKFNMVDESRESYNNIRCPQKSYSIKVTTKC